jgi:hypothetical protein
MAIQETRKKITFTPFEIKKGREVDTSPAPTVTIRKGVMRFNASLVHELSLNGKFVKMFYDPIKSVVGFQIKNEVSLQVVGKTWKLVKTNGKTGIWSITIRKMLNAIGSGYAEKSYYQLPVQKYVEANGMDKGAIYYFVELQGADESKDAEAPELEKQLV